MARFAIESIEKFEEDSFERRIASNLVSNHSVIKFRSFLQAKFNWDQHAHFINSFSHFTYGDILLHYKDRVKHFRTEIEGLSIHFVHISLDYDKKVNRIPILLLPSSFSSFWNFFKVK